MIYFDDPTSKLFSFSSLATGLTEDSFAVIQFKGYEAISKPYDFEILLVSMIIDIDLDDILQSPAVFTIHRGDKDNVLFNGILAEFEQLNEFNGYVYYKARLVPKLWWLNLTKHNQVFLEQTVPEFIELALTDGGLASADFDLAGLEYAYEPIDYVCQYSESHYSFMSRWLEREGIYYYFDQDTNGEQVIFSDSSFSLEPLNQGADLYYSPPSGLEAAHLAEVIRNITCLQKQLPLEVVLKDHNYERPSLNIEGRAEVDAMGRGVSYVYGEHFSTPEEGERLAAIRAEEFLCQKKEFYGESTVPFMCPGYKFNLLEHYRDDFNDEYLITEVTHEGHQTGLLSSGITGGVGAKEGKSIYVNSFKAIPAATRFRPERNTEKPRISGTLHAIIDGELDSEYAQLDEEGRYKVRLPFDINDDHMDGRASARVRMMQPYAGEKRGMQFPMAKGTEVLLTFINGNPDRPIIAGAVNNPTAPGPVNADNQTESVIQTGGNNKIRMEDKFGSERVIFESPASNSWLRIGTKNDPIVLRQSSPHYVINDGAPYDDPLADAHDPADETNVTNPGLAATEVKDSAGNILANGIADIDTSNPGTYYLKYVDNTNTDGTNTENTAVRQVIVYDPSSDTSVDFKRRASDGIRIQTAGNFWTEAQARYGEYTVGKPSFGPTKDQAVAGAPSQIGDMIANYGIAYNPKNLKIHNTQGSYCTDPANAAGASDDSFSNAIANGHVRVSSLDTFNTQEGNIYDFGGYWNYNLGNGFAEEHINQKAVLNNQRVYSWPTSKASYLEEITGTSAGSGAITGGVTSAIGGAVIAAPYALQFATYVGGKLGVAAGVHIWNPGGGTLNALAAVGIGALTAAATFTVAGAAALAGGSAVGGAVGAAAGAGLGAIAPEGESFQGNIGDVLAGPNSGRIITWAARVGSSFAGADGITGKPPEDLVQDPDPSKDSAGPMHTDTTWVTKQFGDSYNFNRGNDISIRVGNTEQHQRGNTFEFIYGGIHEETKFTGDGRKVMWEKGGGGQRQEARWHRGTGMLTSYSYKKDDWFTYEGNFVTVPTVKIATNMSTLRAEVDASIGAMDIGIKATVGMKINVDLTAGLNVNMHGKLGGEADINFVTLEAGFKSFGIKAQKKAAMEAATNDLVLKTVKLNLEQGNLDLKSEGLTVKEKKLAVNAGLQLDGL